MSLVTMVKRLYPRRKWFTRSPRQKRTATKKMRRRRTVRMKMKRVKGIVIGNKDLIFVTRFRLLCSALKQANSSENSSLGHR